MKHIQSMLAAAAALLISASVSFAEVPEIRPDHPRIMFNADTWPAVKKRAEGPAKRYLDALLAFETNDDYTYVASDATACYGGKCTEAVRSFCR